MPNLIETLQPVLIAGVFGGLPASATAIATTQRQYTVLSASIVTSNGQAGVIGVGQMMLLQNADDAATYVALNGTTASNTNFSLVLKACTATDDGNGGSYMIDNYVGPVTIAAATGAPRLAVTIYVS